MALIALQCWHLRTTYSQSPSGQTAAWLVKVSRLPMNRSIPLRVSSKIWWLMVTYSLKVGCLPYAVGKQPFIPLINLRRKWLLNWWWWRWRWWWWWWRWWWWWQWWWWWRWWWWWWWWRWWWWWWWRWWWWWWRCRWWILMMIKSGGDWLKLIVRNSCDELFIFICNIVVVCLLLFFYVVVWQYVAVKWGIRRVWSPVRTTPTTIHTINSVNGSLLCPQAGRSGWMWRTSKWNRAALVILTILK